MASEHVGEDARSPGGPLRGLAADPLEEVLLLYRRGQFLSAHDAGVRAFGPLDVWPRTARHQVLRGRLLNQLGARRRGRAVHIAAARRHLDDAEAQVFGLTAAVSLRGPWSTLIRARALRPKLFGARVQAAHGLAMEARCLSTFRDFDRAFDLLDAADAMSPSDPWLYLTRAQVLRTADRIDAGIDLLRGVVRGQLDTTSSVAGLADLLCERDRIPEAIELLSEKLTTIESGHLEGHLGALLLEVGRFREAFEAFQRARRALCWAEPELVAAVEGRAAEASYRSGDRARALVHAKAADDPFHVHFAERLQAAPDGAGRRALEVEWVRQHHSTCAPATLATLARHFGRAVDHDALAREICYGGTNGYLQREWAERQGFWVREFTLTIEATHALIDRGIPFALTTVGSMSGHIQTVFGYDTLRGTFLIRDPSRRLEMEYEAAELLEHQRASGPRALLLLPPGEASRIADLSLLDAERYDRAHELSSALARFDRAAAQRAFEGLVALGPEHRIARFAALELARYDRDPKRALVVIDALLQVYPKDEGLLLARARTLEGQVSRPEHEAWLARVANDEGHPSLISVHASMLAQDPVRQAEARRLYRRLVRTVPTQWQYVSGLAQVSWNQRRFDEGLELWRLASCAGVTTETPVEAYFSAASLTGRAEEALTFLRARADREGLQSPEPIQSLFEAFLALDRQDEGLQCLERALALHEDGPLRLFAAVAHAKRGQGERAQGLLAAARGHVPAGDLERARLEVARWTGDRATASALAREIVAREPWDVETQAHVVREMAAERGTQAALAYIAEVARDNPAHHGLGLLWLERAKEDGGEAWEEALAHLFRMTPADPWLHRERAVALAAKSRFSEALDAMGDPATRDPWSPAAWGTRGFILRSSGDITAARACLRRAIELDIDYEPAIHGLIELARDPAERHRELEGIEALLKRGPSQGPGLLAFALSARGTYAPEALHAALLGFVERQDGLSASHLALSRELAARGQLERAREILAAATARWPLRADLWAEQASILALARDEAGRLEALERAHRADPECADHTLALAEALLARGEPRRALAVVEAGLLHDASEPTLHVQRAEILWQEGQRAAAMEALERVLLLGQGTPYAWDLFAGWTATEERPAAALEAARRFTDGRPGDAYAFYILARIAADAPQELVRPGEIDDALARALAERPRFIQAHELRVERRVEERRWAEALAACAPAGLEAEPTLRARRGWVLGAKGQKVEAVAELEAVLREHPRLALAWHYLCEILAEGRDVEAYLAASRRFAAAIPESPEAQAWIADAHARAGNREGAKEQHWRALTLLPTHLFSSSEVFQLHLEDRELEQAERALDRVKLVRPKAISTDVAQCALLAASLASRPGAVPIEDLERGFLDLMRRPDCAPWAVARVQRAILEAGQSDLLKRIYLRLPSTPDVHPAALAVWVRYTLDDDPWTFVVAAFASPLTRAGAEALGDLLTNAFDHLPRWRVWSLFVRWRRSMRTWTSLWGAGGNILIRLGARRLAIAWLGDHARREGVEAWHLFNLALALRENGVGERDAAVTRAALALPPDATTPQHQAFAAFHAAWRGQADARDRVSSCPPVPGSAALALGLAEVILAARALAGVEDYGAVAPLHAVLMQRFLALRDPRADALERSLLFAAIGAIARTRPWPQSLWIRMIWGIF